MISPSLRIDGFDGDEWRRLGQLFQPGERRSPPPLLLLVDGPRLVAALRPTRGDAARVGAAVMTGRSSPAVAAAGRPARGLGPLGHAELGRLDWQGPSSLPRLRAQAGAKVAVALEVLAVDRLARAIDAAVDPRHDLVEQSLAAARAVRAEQGRGLHVDPDLLSRIPVPAYAALQQTLDAMLPDDRTAALFVFDDRRPALHASLIVEKRGGHLVRVTSHRALGVAPTDFQGGRHRAILEAVEQRVARPHAALFCTREAWRAVVGPGSGALARQVALRAAVIDPVPPWLLAMTSIGAAASMAQGASRLFGRFVPQGIKDSARDTARALTATPFAALGFDPIQLYEELLKML